MAGVGRGRQSVRRGLAFLSPWLVGFALFTAVPLGLSLYWSFCDYNLISDEPVWVGWRNYRRLLSDDVFWKALRNTAYFALLALPSGTLISVGLAVLLNVRNRGVAVYRAIIFLPSLVPAVAAAMIWMWLFNAKVGLINTALESAGIPGPGWLTSTAWAMPALALMSLWGVGNAVVIYLAGLQDVPAELYEAAEVDGAGPLRRFWHVTLPMLSLVIFFNLVIGVIGALQIVTAPYVMTGGGPARSTYFYAMYVYDNAFTLGRMGYASALAWVQLLLVLGLTALAFWSGRKWVHDPSK